MSDQICDYKLVLLVRDCILVVRFVALPSRLYSDGWRDLYASSLDYSKGDK